MNDVQKTLVEAAKYALTNRNARVFECVSFVALTGETEREAMRVWESYFNGWEHCDNSNHRCMTLLLAAKFA
jgi:hypothetical protein